jgi:hypothetical protein
MSSPAGCSTRATTRLVKNRPVRTGVPLRVTSETVTNPRPVSISTRRPLRVAMISYVRVPPSASTTISTRSPRMGVGYPERLASKRFRPPQREKAAVVSPRLSALRPLRDSPPKHSSATRFRAGGTPNPRLAPSALDSRFSSTAGDANENGPPCGRTVLICSPDGIRTRATALRGRRARPLHNGAMARRPDETVPKQPRATAMSGFAGVLGLEPRMAVPETAVLPITPYPKGVSELRCAWGSETEGRLYRTGHGPPKPRWFRGRLRRHLNRRWLARAGPTSCPARGSRGTRRGAERSVSPSPPPAPDRTPAEV